MARRSCGARARGGCARMRSGHVETRPSPAVKVCAPTNEERKRAPEQFRDAPGRARAARHPDSRPCAAAWPFGRSSAAWPRRCRLAAARPIWACLVARVVLRLKELESRSSSANTQGEELLIKLRLSLPASSAATPAPGARQAGPRQQALHGRLWRRHALFRLGGEGYAASVALGRRHTACVTLGTLGSGREKESE